MVRLINPSSQVSGSHARYLLIPPFSKYLVGYCDGSGQWRTGQTKKCMRSKHLFLAVLGLSGVLNTMCLCKTILSAFNVGESRQLMLCFDGQLFLQFKPLKTTKLPYLDGFSVIFVIMRYSLFFYLCDVLMSLSLKKII